MSPHTSLEEAQSRLAEVIAELAPSGEVKDSGSVTRKCPQCGFAAPPDLVIRFCGRCGAALEGEESPTKQKYVLLVDDSALSRRKMAAILKRLGCRVVEAKDGSQALELARAEPPDLIVMDVMMPVMSGLEALQILRADARFAATPIIMLTSKADATTVSQALEHHASDYLLKDSPPEEIGRRLQKYLSPS